MSQNDPIQPAPRPEWLLMGDLPCLGDGYNMRGLVGPVVKCPECGHLNDLRDPSPWKKIDLPLGVRQREHWPASAAGCGFTAVFFTPVSLALWDIFGLLVLILGSSLVLGSLIAWGVLCVSFIRSAQSVRWSTFVLVATHVAAAATLTGGAGLIYAMAIFNDPDAQRELPTALWLTASLPGGLLLFCWLRHQFKKQDNPSTFRVDWRSYQIPVEHAPHDSYWGPETD